MDLLWLCIGCSSARLDLGNYCVLAGRGDLIFVEFAVFFLVICAAADGGGLPYPVAPFPPVVS